MEFEWDPRQAARNARKHGVSFAEAATVFADPLSMTVEDPDHSSREERCIIFGWSNRQRLLMVAQAENGDRIRISSARELTRVERETYEQET